MRFTPALIVLVVIAVAPFFLFGWVISAVGRLFN